MKLAVSAKGQNLDAQVDPRFGRCTYFTIVDPDTMAFESIGNNGSMASGGAGIAAAQQIVDKAADAVLTGNCGPNAFNVLNAAGIKVYTGAMDGTVQDAVNGYKEGKYGTISGPDASAHSGMG